MTRYVIDPATLLRIAASDVVPHPDHQLVAPGSIRSQALQLMLDRVRAGELAAADAMRLHDHMTAVKLRALGDRVSRRAAWDIALVRGMTIDEAEYLAVTMLQADALVATDGHLAELARGVVATAGAADLERAGPSDGSDAPAIS